MLGFWAVLPDDVVALAGGVVIWDGVPTHGFGAAAGPAHGTDLVDYPL